MGAGPVPPGLLVTPALLSRYNVPSAFLAQFAARAFQLLISTGGPLGTMAFQWALAGDTNYSAPILSSIFTPWLTTIDDLFVDLAFPPGTYVANTTYTIDAVGNVTLGAGAIAGVTAAIFDRRFTACSAVTTQAMQLMRDAIRPPLLSWGDDATTHAAAWAYEILKRGVGATPPKAGTGEAIVLSGEEQAIKFFTAIGENGRPDSMTDSSTSTDGPLIPAYPSGDDLRGW